MSLSNEEKILRELQNINAQLNPGKALLKALFLLVLCAIAFTGFAMLLNNLPSRAPVHAKPVPRGAHTRSSHNSPQPQVIKESFQ
jgi:hypothetical protein